MPKSFYVVDAFTAEPFAGNPAAIVLDAAGLTDRRMQQVAAEFNLSETTFVLPAERPMPGRLSLRFRWFTPMTEAAMCGHATVAGVHALLEAGRLTCPEGDNLTVHIETRSGPLTAFVEHMPGEPSNQLIWLELRPPELTSHSIDAQKWAAALRIPGDAFDPGLPSARTQDQDLLAFVNDVVVLNAARPDFGALSDLLTGDGLRGICLATVRTLTPSIAVQSRFFAPPAGIDEDPVTGSVHGPLALYLVEQGIVPVREGLAGMMCGQGKAGGRAGVIYALLEQRPGQARTVRIGGQSVTTAKGTLLD